MPAIAGKSVAHRQLLFAREVGCESVIAFGSGASPDGIDLRHAAERVGVKFSVISTAHALPGIIREDDSLLVLTPGLLPESRVALDLLRAEGDRILVVSAGPGARAGFERIDLDRAWAGAMTIPGHLLGGLAGLPEDVAPHGALLRIALQQRLPEARLADSSLDDGRWIQVSSREVAESRTAEWLHNQLGGEVAGAPSRWLARKFITGAGSKLAQMRHARAAALTLALCLMGASMAAGIYERPAFGFALAALSVPVLELFLAISRLGVAPFGELRRWPWICFAVDATLFVLGVLAIDSLPYRAIFPPAVLAFGLLLLDKRVLPRWLLPLKDRMVIGGFLAILAAIAKPELGIMLAGLLVLAANTISPRR
ncbi:hypothetical protein [Aurantiacibacter zhengii]|nr:hypothetical protein [Aurantiacibacter zhengii]